MLHSSAIKGERTHCIRQIMLPHTCGTRTDTSRINSSWVAKKYEDEIRSDPSMCVTALMDAVLRDHGVEISKHMAYRAKNRALESVVGDEDAQFTRIKDYLQIVIDKDPGSRCHVTTVQPIPQKNISEVFNSYILKFRDKPIRTMIDSIRTKIMVRYATKREGVETVQWEITPTFAERLEWEKKNSRWWQDARAKKGLWQVTNMGRTYEVNLDERKCGCFKWDLTGIPCKTCCTCNHQCQRIPRGLC
uniref:Uncharacterized protein n=1 Tax=Avena sativa TaxID=4498 RepID=A0ACD5UIJ1_AVESA